MQTATATLPRPSATPPAMPRDQQLQTLRHDLTAARQRNRTFERAILEAARAATVVGVVPGTDREHAYTMFYSNGSRVERRWSAADGWHDTVIAPAPDSVAAHIDALFVEDRLSFVAEMSVSTGDVQ